MFFLLALSAQAQSYFRVFARKDENRVFIYAENYAPVEYSVKITYDIDNLNTYSGRDEIVYIVPPNTTNYLLDQLNVIDVTRAYYYSYKYKSKIGNVLAEHDKRYTYELPVHKDSIKVQQGYFGKSSHKEKYALDFPISIGTPVYAARSGIIANVIQEHNKHCFHKKCAKFNNKVVVYHEDGSFANYTHLKKGGAVVVKGQKINVGDLLGYSGNTGYSSGPHLHFEVYVNRIDKAISVPTLFHVLNKNSPQILQEKSFYKPCF